jgi:hypothetical protein
MKTRSAPHPVCVRTSASAAGTDRSTRYSAVSAKQLGRRDWVAGS